jgi:hypothetical protein
VRVDVIHWDDSAALISGKVLNSISELLQDASNVVQQLSDRTQSVSPQKMVIVQFTRKRGLLVYLLNSWSRVHCEKLASFWLVKNFPTFHGTRRFITSFTSANLCEHFITR